MGKAPAFQLFAADFLADVAEWSNEEVGVYTRLLFYSWINEGISTETERLARLAHCSEEEFKKPWKIVKKKFIPQNEKLVNARLETGRKEQEERRKKLIESGKRGANIRWNR